MRTHFLPCRVVSARSTEETHFLAFLLTLGSRLLRTALAPLQSGRTS